MSLGVHSSVWIGTNVGTGETRWLSWSNLHSLAFCRLKNTSVFSIGEYTWWDLLTLFCLKTTIDRQTKFHYFTVRDKKVVDQWRMDWGNYNLLITCCCKIEEDELILVVYTLCSLSWIVTRNLQTPDFGKSRVLLFLFGLSGNQWEIFAASMVNTSVSESIPFTTPQFQNGFFIFGC